MGQCFRTCDRRSKERLKGLEEDIVPIEMLTQVNPAETVTDENNTKLQTVLKNKLGEGAVPFTLKVQGFVLLLQVKVSFVHQLIGQGILHAKVRKSTPRPFRRLRDQSDQPTAPATDEQTNEQMDMWVYREIQLPMIRDVHLNEANSRWILTISHKNQQRPLQIQEIAKYSYKGLTNYVSYVFLY